MATVANAQGIVNVNLTIPANVPAGAKEIVITGAGGSTGRATYIGRGTITQQEFQQVTTQRIAAARGVDPLAQTFTLQETRMVAGANIYLTNKGSNVAKNAIVVQIRGVSVGLPNDEIFAQAVVNWDDLNLQPVATTVQWPPVALLAGQTYAIVVMSDDPVQALQVAKVGEFDATNQKRVAAQPYQIGVLLSSSNAQTWTPHQDMDMKFQLLAAKFTAPQREIVLSTHSVTAATDLVVLSGVTRPDISADFHYRLVMSGGVNIVVPERQLVKLTTPYTGDIEVRAVLTSTNDHFSPILHGGVQLMAGTVSNTDTYYSRAIPASPTSKIDVRVDLLLTGSANVQVDYQKDNAGPWVTVPSVGTSSAANGFTEHHFQVAAATGIADHVRIRLTLNGNTANRPRVRDLRSFAT